MKNFARAVPSVIILKSKNWTNIILGLRKILGKISSTTISDELYSPNTKIVGNFSKIFIQIFDSAERILFESRIIE